MSYERHDFTPEPSYETTEEGVVQIIVAGDTYTYEALPEKYKLTDKDGQEYFFETDSEGKLINGRVTTTTYVDPEVTQRRQSEAFKGLQYYLKETLEEAKEIWDKAA